MIQTEISKESPASTQLKVEAITLRELQMPLVHFFETSFGRTYSRRILLLTVHCDGIDGWGECVAGEDPFYSSEWIESAWPTIKKYLAPAVLGKTLSSGRESVSLLARVRGHRMAKAAVENALWDTEAKQKNQPLWKLLMLEQPLWNDDIFEHARLQKQLRTPICLDESIRHARDAAIAAETDACRIINIKVGRVGGFTEAKKVHDVCQGHNIPVWCGGMLESGIGRSHNVALSTLENFRLP